MLGVMVSSFGIKDGVELLRVNGTEKEVRDYIEAVNHKHSLRFVESPIFSTGTYTSLIKVYHEKGRSYEEEKELQG